MQPGSWIRLVKKVAPWLGILLALTGILLLKSCGDSPSVGILPDEPVVAIEQGSRRPPSRPGSPPQSLVQIVNAAGIDGIPLTVGQSITLRGSSPAIEWRDSTGRVLGRGSQLVYQAQRVGMEIITARIGQAAQSQVSFTVRTPDVVLQPHVKVLSDELAAAVQTFDPQAGILVMNRVPGIPTLAVGDVVVGAGLRVRPAQILSLTETESEIQAQIQLALPRQVIKQGSISQWQRVVIGSEGQLERVNPATLARSGTCDSRVERRLTVTLPGIPSQTFTIDIPLPFPGFKQLQSSLTTQLDAQVVAEAGFCPLFEPPQIDFQEEGNLFSGIHRFEMGAGLTDISAQTYLDLNGLAEWGLRQRFPDPPQELIDSPVMFVGNLGPVSVWVGFDVLGSIPVEVGAQLSVNGARVGVSYSGGRFVQRIRYADGSGWDNTPEFTQGQFSRILEGKIDLNGYLKVGVNPEIEAEIWGSVVPAPRLKLFTLPKIGLNVYAKAELDLLPEDVAVEISQPQAGAVLDGRDPITLNARISGDPELKLLGGVDFTLRDGRVEDNCPLPQIITRNSSSAVCEDWIDGLRTRTVTPRDDRYRYQIRVTESDNEYHVLALDEMIWADGIRASDCYLLEAKHIGNPSSSPYIPDSSIPETIRQNILEQVRNEIRRYKKAIEDACNPSRGLEIITNYQEAVQTFQALLNESGISNGRVRVQP